MPDNVTEYELRYKIDQAEAALAKAQRDAQAAEAAIAALKDAYQRGAVTGQEYGAQIGALNAALARQQQAAQQAAAALAGQQGQVVNAGAATQQLAAQMARGAGGAAGWQQALIQLGYTVDDAQAGFRGIANNIQPLLSAIPGLARIAPPIAIAATVGYELYTHWDKFQALVKGTPLEGPIGEMTAAFRSLGEAIGLASTAADKLVEAGRKASEATAKVVGADQEERARRFTETIKGQGGGAAVEAELVRKALEQTPGQSPEGARTREALFRQLFAKAQTGDQGAIARVTETLGPTSDFSQAFEGASPENKRAVEDLEKRNEAVRAAAQANNDALDDADKQAAAAHKAWLDERVKETVKALENEPKAAAGKGVGVEFIVEKLLATNQYTRPGAVEVATPANAQLGADAAAAARVRALGGGVPEALKSERVRSEFVGASDVIRRAQTAALSGKDDGLNKLIEESNKHLADIAKNTKDAGNGMVFVD